MGTNHAGLLEVLNGRTTAFPCVVRTPGSICTYSPGTVSVYPIQSSLSFPASAWFVRVLGSTGNVGR
jgi:hypothetical protein